MSSNPPAASTPTPRAAWSAAGQDGAATGGADNTSNSPGSAYGRAPQVARNGFSGPGVHNIDARISREFPITEKYRLQFLVEAFNVANHRNGLGVATTAFAYTTPGAATCPTGTHVNTCIAPYTATTTTTTPFGVINSTSGTLYGPRQIQVAAKLFF